MKLPSLRPMTQGGGRDWSKEERGRRDEEERREGGGERKEEGGEREREERRERREEGPQQHNQCQYTYVPPLKLARTNHIHTHCAAPTASLLVQLCDVVPQSVVQPLARIVHLCLPVQHHSATQEEVVLIHVDLVGHLQNLGTHVKGKQQLVALKQTTASVPWRERGRKERREEENEGRDTAIDASQTHQTRQQHKVCT